jgi:hypothetical protein
MSKKKRMKNNPGDCLRAYPKNVMTNSVIQQVKFIYTIKTICNIIK